MAGAALVAGLPLARCGVSVSFSRATKALASLSSSSLRFRVVRRGQGVDVRLGLAQDG